MRTNYKVGLIILLVLLAFNIQAQSTKEQELNRQINEAVANEEYTKASELKKQLEALNYESTEVKRLEAEIKIAADAGDYEKAASLKKQLDGIKSNGAEIQKLEKEIEIAVKAEDFEKAARLQKDLDILKKGGQIPSSVDTTTINQDKTVKTTSTEEIESKENYVRSRNTDEGMIKGYYYDFLIGGSSVGIISRSSPNDSWTSNSGFSLQLGARIGYRRFFSFGNYKVGYQFTWVRINLLPGSGGNNSLLTVEPLNVGLTNRYDFSEKNSIEFNFNIGLTYMRSVKSGDNGGGLNFDFDIKYTINRLCIGINIGNKRTILTDDDSELIGGIFYFSPFIGLKYY